MRVAPELAGDIVLNTVRYVIDKRQGWLEGEAVDLQEGSPQIPISAEWPLGLPGGLGETFRTGPNSAGSAFATFDTSAYGFYRMPPRRITVQPTTVPVDRPTWFREERAGDATFEVGTFTASAGTGVQTVTHSLGVAPKALILWSGGKLANATAADDGHMGMGFASGGGSEFAISSAVEDAVSNTRTGRESGTNCFVRVSSDATPVLLDSAINAAFTASNFTIDWNTRNGGAGLQMHYMLIAGTDVSAKVVTWTIPQSGEGTDKSVTGAGFRPDLVLHLTDLTQGAVATNGASFTLGMMDSSGTQWSAGFASEDNVASSNGISSLRTDATLVPYLPTTAIAAVTAYLSMDADGFTTRTITFASGAYTVGALCLKGIRAKLAQTTKATGAAPVNQVAETIAFTSTAFLAVSHMAATASPSDRAALTIGAVASATQRAATAMLDEDNQNPSDNAGIDYSANALANLTLATPATVLALADTLGADVKTAGWLRWTTNDATATLINYLAFAPLATSSTAQPYILAFNGQTCSQMSVSATPAITVVQQKDFAAAAQCGHPAKFLNEWYAPLGGTVAFQRLTAITTTGMTWVADVSRRHSFGLRQRPGWTDGKAGESAHHEQGGHLN